jgi:hypothetical protein
MANVQTNKPVALTLGTKVLEMSSISIELRRFC